MSFSFRSLTRSAKRPISLPSPVRDGEASRAAQPSSSSSSGDESPPYQEHERDDYFAAASSNNSSETSLTEASSQQSRSRIDIDTYMQASFDSQVREEPLPPYSQRPAGWPTYEQQQQRLVMLRQQAMQSQRQSSSICPCASCH